MKTSSKRWLLIVLLLALFFGALFVRGETIATNPAGELLLSQIEAALQRNHTPGAGVAIVRREGPEWIAGVGLADVAAKKPVTPDTLFRIGSTSKGFVALAILKLQSEGKLNLQDTLKSRAPDLDFENPWEQTDPVRIVHLLEHTSGWDEMAFGDDRAGSERELTLQEGLAYRPGTRRSRWKPGTRFAYSNIGPCVAAYVVEKVTGERFEDYVRRTWFAPLGMTTASYFGSPDVRARLATLYEGDGKTVVPYARIRMRPSGSLNASARELANYVQFYLNRGAFGGVQLLPASAIGRMERATSTYAAREGLSFGYGLGNYSAVQDGWIYHGHDGGVPGCLTALGYLPEAGAGYVIMINSFNVQALAEISRLIRAHLTRGLTPPTPPAPAPVSAATRHDYSGWYEPASPRAGYTHFVGRLLGISKFAFNESELIWKPLTRHPARFVPVNERVFRGISQPVGTLALVADCSEGTFIQMAGVSGLTFRRIPGWLVGLELVASAAVALAMLTTVAFALLWVPRKLLGRLRGVDHLNVRLLPLLATLSAVGFAELFVHSGGIANLGRVSTWSLALFFLTLALPAFAGAGVVQALRLRQAGIGRVVWWHSLLTSTLMTVVAVYLGYWGIIGLRTWV